MSDHDKDKDLPFNGNPQTEREWRILISYRLYRVEKRLDDQFRILVALLVMVMGGVIIYYLTSAGGVGAAP